MSDGWQPPSELPDLRNVGTIALDTEGKDDGIAADLGSSWPWGAGYVCGISVAYRINGAVHSHYIPIRHPDSPNFDCEQVRCWLRDLFASNTHIVTQNGLFDYGWLSTDLNVAMPPAERLEEIGAAASMIDENRTSYTLDNLCKWRGIPGKDERLLLEGCRALGLIPKGRKKFVPQAHIWQLPAHYVGAYAEGDASSTLVLYESLNPVLDQEKTRGAYRLEVKLMPMVHAMRKRGIRVDTARAEEVRDLMLAKRDTVLKQLSEKHGTGIDMTAIRSDKQLAKICDGYGISYPRTPKGNPSFTSGLSGWMDKSDHWLPPLVDRARKYDNSAKFVENTINHAKNGRVYAEIHPHHGDIGGARTSRFSYSHPALQQTPKHNEELAPLIRGLYLPEEGEVWASCDLSQQEFRMIVDYATRYKLPGAIEMCDEYIRNPRLDIHQATADRSNGALDRHGGKGLNFGKFYGMGIEKFANRIGKSQEEARALYDLYDQIMPFVSRLTDVCKQKVWTNGYLTLIDGMRMHFNQWVAGAGKWERGAGPCSREEAERRTHDASHKWYGQRLYRADVHKALNSLIQSSSARYTKMWMLDVWKAGVTPMLQMHDSLDLSVSSPEQAEMVAHLGEKVVELKVPMVVDLKFGRNWNDAVHTWDKLHAAAGSHIEPAVELPDDRERVQRKDPPPWDDDSALDNRSPEPPHICIHCRLDPPDGTERASAYGGAWMHECCEDTFILARMAEEGIAGERELPRPPPQSPPPQSPPPQAPKPQDDEPPDGNGHDRASGGNGAWRGGGSITEAAKDTYTEEHAGEPFSDADLLRQGYKLVRAFNYTLPDETPLYQQNRYELKKGYTPSKKRPRKRFLPHHKVDWRDIIGAGNRRVVYNWPAVMRAGPGSTVFVCEGEANAEALISAGLLATTVLSHAWTQECVTALAGCHLIILQDHDDDGERYAAITQKKLASVATSTRVIPAPHLWKHLPGNKAPRPHDDVQDWIKLGGDPHKLLDICRKIPAEGIITAEPFRFRAEADIPPWDWLYGQHLLRGEVSTTVATGGTGKSTKSIVEAVAIASGRTLLPNEDVSKPLRVVLINLEDTRNTMEKRIAATMRHYGLIPADVDNRLIVIAKGEVKIKVARQLRSGDVERNEQTIRALIRLVAEHRADVLSIDSLIRTHKVNENDNSAMQEVIECYEDVALPGRCAVHLWHHTRKPGGEKATIESARGASALIDACRAVRLMDKMSAKEHEELREIQPDMLPPGHYFRTFSGKRSFAPPADQSDWFKIENLTLANNDNVGVVTPWRYPASQEAIAPELAKDIVAEIGRGMPNGQRFSASPGATRRQAWPIVQKHCPDKTRDQCRRIVADWIRRGLLYEDDYDDPIYRKHQRGLFAQTDGEDEA
jgi:DNA polymerase I-like protein with 3'-5' exonuclease and polymerase domains